MATTKDLYACRLCEYVVDPADEQNHGCAPASPEPCRCGAPLVWICRVGPGHEVVQCERGCVHHSVERFLQPCPWCGADMYIEQSHLTGRYVYRCQDDHAHVQIEANCAGPLLDERIFLTVRRAR